jgi:hypothetical protein
LMARFLEMCLSVGKYIAGSQVQILPISGFHLSEDAQVFPAGDREHAVAVLQQWLSDHGIEYVKLYDPYFAVSELPFLRFVKAGCQVSIVTTWPVRLGIKVGDKRGIETLYRQAWADNVGGEPPETQVVVVGTAPNGGSPLHDRYFISQDAGIAVGTSVSSLGNKDSSMLVLSDDKRKTIESQIVDIWLMPGQKTYQGDPIIRHMFML